MGFSKSGISEYQMHNGEILSHNDIYYLIMRLFETLGGGVLASGAVFFYLSIKRSPAYSQGFCG